MFDNVKTHREHAPLSRYLSDLRTAVSHLDSPMLLISNLHKYTHPPVSQMIAKLVFSNRTHNFPVIWRRVKKEGLPSSEITSQTSSKYCHRKPPYSEVENLKRDIYARVLQSMKEQKTPEQQIMYFPKCKVLVDSNKSFVSSRDIVCLESRGSIYRLNWAGVKKIVPNSATHQPFSDSPPLLFATKSFTMEKAEWKFFGNIGVMVGYNVGTRYGQNVNKNFEILLVKDMDKLATPDQQGSMDYEGVSAQTVSHIPVSRDEALCPVWTYSHSEILLLFGTKLGEGYYNYKRGVVAEILEISDCAKVERVTRIDLTAVVGNFERTDDYRCCMYLPSKQQYFFGTCQSKDWWSGPFERIKLYAFQWSRGAGTLDFIGTGNFQLTISSHEHEPPIYRLSGTSFQMPQFMISGGHMYCLYHYKPGHIAMFVYHKLAFHQILNGGYKQPLAQLSKSVGIPYATADQQPSAYCLRLDHRNPYERVEYSILQLRIHL